MAKRVATPSFVAEFPLGTTDADERTLDIRLDAARQIYNAVLGEALKRLRRMREDLTWTTACKMPKSTPTERKTRNAAFAALRAKHGFTPAPLQKFAETCRDACWIGDHIGGHDTQSTATRAFRAVERYIFKASGRPRFKGKNQLHSIEGKSNEAVIRYRETTIPAIHYDSLILPLRLDRKDKKLWQANALGHSTKYCRIVKRTIRGRNRWYVQLVQRGTAPRLHDVNGGTVGLDIGPSEIAVVTDRDATVERFCQTIEQPWKESRRIDRAMDRSRRATNLERFDEKGRWIKRRRGQPKQRLVRSIRYLHLASERRETERRLAAERKRSHGQLQNDILSEGSTVKTEKLSYRSFQKNFGRSTKVRAPGMFVSGLKRKAESAGGQLLEINTRYTKLSQFDHTTMDHVRKPLSERIHIFRDGVTQPIQRDLYSAFLARCCDPDTLDVSQVLRTWPAAEPPLRRAMSRYNDQRAKERALRPVRVRGDRAARRPSQGQGRREQGPRRSLTPTPESPTKAAPKPRPSGRGGSYDRNAVLDPTGDGREGRPPAGTVKRNAVAPRAMANERGREVGHCGDRRVPDDRRLGSRRTRRIAAPAADVAAPTIADVPDGGGEVIRRPTGGRAGSADHDDIAREDDAGVRYGVPAMGHVDDDEVEPSHGIGENPDHVAARDRIRPGNTGREVGKVADARMEGCGPRDPDTTRDDVR